MDASARAGARPLLTEAPVRGPSLGPAETELLVTRLQGQGAHAHVPLSGGAQGSVSFMAETQFSEGQASGSTLCSGTAPSRAQAHTIYQQAGIGHRLLGWSPGGQGAKHPD
jgi:hypothetical protein